MILRQVSALQLTGVLIGLTATSGSAATLFDTGQPDNTASYSIYDYGQGDARAVAARITLSDTYTINQVDGWFGSTLAGQDQILVSIHRTSQTGGLGEVLAQDIGVVPAFAPGTPSASWVSTFTDNGPTLQPGDYWISFAADAANPQACRCAMLAFAPNPILFGAYRNNFTGGNWSEREMNFGLRVFGTAAAAVPEPATWAMMIGGFGLLGASARRRMAVSTSFS